MGSSHTARGELISFARLQDELDDRLTITGSTPRADLNGASLSLERAFGRHQARWHTTRCVTQAARFVVVGPLRKLVRDQKPSLASCELSSQPASQSVGLSHSRSLLSCSFAPSTSAQSGPTPRRPRASQCARLLALPRLFETKSSTSADTRARKRLASALLRAVRALIFQCVDVGVIVGAGDQC